MLNPVREHSPETAQSGSSLARFPSLDGLRAVSIVLVLASHSIQGTHSFVFRLLFLHADLGVRVFFVISGFLITSLLLRERSASGGISLRLFYMRRTLRILPAFGLFVGCVAILHAFGIVPVPASIWPYVLTYTVNFAPLPPWVFGHLWSLSVEEQFYLLWPLAMKFARPKVWTSIAIVAVFAGSALHATYSLTGVKLLDPALHYAFPFVCGPIAMGCLLAIHAPTVGSFVASPRLFTRNRARTGRATRLGLVLPIPLPPRVAARALAGDLVFVFAVPLIAWLDALDAGTSDHYIGLVTNTLLTLCVARLVFVPTGIVGRVLNSTPFVGLGKLSYSLYLFQQLFLDSMSTAPLPIPFPLNLAAAFTAALVCYGAVEVRFLGLRSRFRQAGDKIAFPGKLYFTK